jgi:hypothetical protein
MSAMSADTPTDLVAQVSLSADTHFACLAQSDESTMSADTLIAVQAAPGDTPASLEGMPGTPEEVTATAAHADDMAGFPEGMPGTPEDVTAMAAHADDTADKPGDVADSSGDVADSSGDRQAGIGLPLSALQADAEKEKRLEEKEEQLRYEMGEQLEEKEKRLEEKLKLFKYKEEKKKRIQYKKEEWWTDSRSMTPLPRYSRSSRTRSSSRE